MQAHRNLHFDPSPLLLKYGAPPGGRRQSLVEDFHRNHVDQVMLAYNVPEGSASLSINARVTMEHIYGKPGSAPVAPVQCINGLTYPQGAPNGGVRVALPPRALQYLVNR